jgi:polar amino acid transport system permease protein
VASPGSAWGRFADTFLNGRVMLHALPDIAAGLLTTVELAALVVLCGLLAGLALALLRSGGVRVLNWLIVGVVDLFRALPPLVVIVLVYFGLPAVGPTPSGFVSTWASLSCVLAAFSEEIFWAGITAVPRGQWEAARSTGLPWADAMRHVVLPQAMRLCVPPLTNRTIAITKNTALGSVVALPEVLAQAQSAVSFTYNPSPLLLGAAAYLLLFLPVVVFGRWVERRFAAR